MNTILNEETYNSTVNRINLLSANAEGRWGKMNTNQLLCHLSDPLRDILGIRAMQPVLPPAVQQQLKAVVLSDNQWEHNLQTFAPYSQDEDGQGTKPTNFEQDRNSLLELTTAFYNTPTDFTFYPHAGLNVLTREEFGVYVWRHTDYHLNQFGV